MTQAELRKQVSVKEKTVRPSINELTPVVIDFENPTEEEVSLLERASTINFELLQNAIEEISSLASFYQATLNRLPEAARTNPDAFQDYVLTQLVEDLPEAEQSEAILQLREIYHEYSYVFRDVLRFANEIIQESSNLPDEDDYQYCIYFPNTNGGEVVPFVSHSAFSLLRRSRLLGLVSFDSLDSLAQLKIACIGASVAAESITALIDYGVGDDPEGWIHFSDPGKIDSSNGPRLPGIMSWVSNLNRSKAETLYEQLIRSNPFANIQAYSAAVVENPANENEIDLIKFTQDADLVIEVIDNAAGKIGIRLAIGDKKPIVFIADLSPIAMAGIEHSSGLPFNQHQPPEEWMRALEKIKNSKDPLTAQARYLLAIFNMLEDYVPERHLNILALNALSLHPFLSQEPADARINAAMVVRMIVELIENEEDGIAGKNLTMAELQEIYLQREVDRVYFLERIKQVLAAKAGYTTSERTTAQELNSTGNPVPSQTI
jgi:hypothetical protein